MTPYILFLLDHPDVVFYPPPDPKHLSMQEFAEGPDNFPVVKLPSITLNVSTSSISDFKQTSVGFEFKCRMGGVSTDIVIPFAAILHVYDNVSKVGVSFMSDLRWVTELIVDLKKRNNPPVSERVTGPDYGPLVVTDKVKPKSHLSIVK